MSARTKDIWICLILFGAALALRMWLAAQLPFPQLDDPAAYIQVARHIAAGRGFVSDVIWNYWVPFNSVTHPSNEFWTPLAMILMAGSIRIFGDTLFAAQLPGIVCGALIVPVSYLIGRHIWPRQRRWSVLAAALLVPSAVAVVQSVSADSSTLYTLLSMLALFTATLALERRSLVQAGLCGLLCGFAYLARSHGTLLPVGIGFVGLIVLRHERRKMIALGTVMLIGYFALVVPWWLRNLNAFGTLQPIPLITIVASRDYADWYNYTNQPTLALMLAQGWPTIFGGRIDALIKDLGVIFTLTFPFGILGLPVVWLRREYLFRLFAVYGTILFLGISLILSSSGPGGALYHSAGPFAVWAAWGSIIVIKHWYDHPATRRLAIATYLLIFGLCVGQLILTWPNAVLQSGRQGDQFAMIATWLQGHVPSGEPILTTQAHSLNYISGYPTLSVPIKQSADILRQIAERYQVRFVVITEQNGLYPSELDDPASGFELTMRLPDTSIYRLKQ
jgi:4-amino-4-deoxy-L-arabinose transferase-like glycosyltransferase